jgi:hypothetical protein
MKRRKITVAEKTNMRLGVLMPIDTPQDAARFGPLPGSGFKEAEALG